MEKLSKAAKARAASRTHRMAAVITVTGLVVQNADQLQPLFGDYGGIVIAACGAVMHFFREITKEPVGAKTAASRSD